MRVGYKICIIHIIHVAWFLEECYRGELLVAKKYTLFSQMRGFYQSPTPGHFAAITTQKIAGRLDCPSGEKAKSENRIFLQNLHDRPKGFRLCKICKPWIVRVGDRLDYLEKRAAALQHKPHVSLWATGMLKPDKDEYKPCRWYAAMNWYEGEDSELGPIFCQHTLSKHFRYHKAFSTALREGRQLNLPVIKHNLDIIVLWLPTEESTLAQETLVSALQDNDVINIAGRGTTKIDPSQLVYYDEDPFA